MKDMKHPFSLALFGIVLILAGVLLGLFLVRANLITIPSDWTENADDGAGVIENADDESGEGEIPIATSESGNMIVTSPTSGEIIGLPLVVKGKARVFENTLNYRVIDADGVTVLAEGHVTANAPDVGEFGDFTITTSYDAPSGDAGTIEVFDYSAKDGSIVDLVEIPVTFPTSESMTLNVYWTTDASSDDCSTVVATSHRVAKTSAVAHAALSELLAGPDTTDSANGFSSSIPKFTLLKSVSLEDGVATVELSKAVEAGGSCRVGLIRAQIEATLKQFPTITKVVIKTEGLMPEESLQP